MKYIKSIITSYENYRIIKNYLKLKFAHDCKSIGKISLWQELVKLRLI